MNHDAGIPIAEKKNNATESLNVHSVSYTKSYIIF